MSAMSRNNSASTLMGFSVHQPTLGAALQFFPAMGSQQLDELINAYVPGSASILDKRATVSMEFFDHSLATGETFKFFMVYNTASPAMDSGYASSFTTSPTMSDSQWQPSTNASSKKVTSQKMSDFSELPGMKILTKDGLDVTNSVSRGCKTKEQRDHAHLMRIIKACDSCRRKKTKCDPSHKRTASTASSSKVTKKTSKSARPAAAPRIPVQQAPVTPALDQTTAESFSFDSLVSESFDTMDNAPMEWEQFVHFDEEPVIPYDYNFFDPASYLTPATSSSFTSPSTSPHVPITPVDQQSPEVHPGTSNQLAEVPAPNLPYLNPGGLESSTNYIDFNLYSPAASLDDDFGTGKELVAPPQPDYSDYVGRHLSEPDGDRHRQRISHSRPARGTAVAQLAANDARIESMLSSPVDIFSDFAGDAFFCQDELGYRQQSSSLGSMHDVNDYEGVADSRRAQLSPEGVIHGANNYIQVHSSRMRTASSAAPQATLDHVRAAVVDRQRAPAPTLLSSTAVHDMSHASIFVGDHVVLDVTSQGLYGRETIGNHDQSRAVFSRPWAQEVLSTSISASTSSEVSRSQQTTAVMNSPSSQNRLMMSLNAQSSMSSVSADGTPEVPNDSSTTNFSYAKSTGTRAIGLPTPILSPVESKSMEALESKISIKKGMLLTVARAERHLQSSTATATQLAVSEQGIVVLDCPEHIRNSASLESSRLTTTAVRASAYFTQDIVSGIGACVILASYCLQQPSVSSGRLVPAKSKTIREKGTQLAGADGLLIYVTVLFLCISMFMPTEAIAFVVAGTLSLTAIRLRRTNTLSSKGIHTPNMLSFAEELITGVTNNARVAYIGLERFIRCGLSQKIASLALPPTSSSSSRQSGGTQTRAVVAHTIF